jgi:RNA polymerase sigma-70 factor (ECF subfamily)
LGSDTLRRRGRITAEGQLGRFCWPVIRPAPPPVEAAMDGMACPEIAWTSRPARPAWPRRAVAYRPERRLVSELRAPTPAPAGGDDPASLIEAVARSGDREAFSRLFTAFAPRVKGYLMGLGTTAAAAEELAQETLLAVWRKAAFYDRSRAGAATWIFTIARNLRIDAARRERSALAYQLEIADEPQAEVEVPEALVAGEQRDRRVREALKSLSPEQVTVVRLSFFQEKPHSEIARDLGIPLGTVKSRVRLAMSRLRERLEELL